MQIRTGVLPAFLNVKMSESLVMASIRPKSCEVSSKLILGEEQPGRRNDIALAIFSEAASACTINCNSIAKRLGSASL